MSTTATIDQATLQQWLTEKLDMQAVESRLQSLGLDAETIRQCLKDYRKCCIAKKTVYRILFFWP